MYVPEAKQLTTGGTFSKSAVKGYWDTPEIAKLLLHYFIKGNPHRIDQDRSPVSGKTLREVAQPAFEEEAEPGPVVDAFLEVREALRLASNAMVCFRSMHCLKQVPPHGEVCLRSCCLFKPWYLCMSFTGCQWPKTDA